MTKKKADTKLKNQIKVTQIRSYVGRPADQRKTLTGLGLGKIGNSRILEDTLSIQGMVKKVRHLVSVEAI